MVFNSVAAAATKSLQSCQILCHPHRWQPNRLPRPWDSPGKNTGVGCHFLLQCMKEKSESEVAQSCLTLSDPRDCSLPLTWTKMIIQILLPLNETSTTVSKPHTLSPLPHWVLGSPQFPSDLVAWPLQSSCGVTRTEEHGLGPCQSEP